MSTKSNRNRTNQESESRLIDHSKIEERAVEISLQEGRDEVNNDDRARAREELLAPNVSLGDPEVSPELGAKDVTAWDEAPESRGHKVERVLPEDENSVGKELVENGMRGPTRNSPTVEP